MVIDVAAVAANKRSVERVFSEAFNQGDLGVIDELVSPAGLDHQHPDEADFAVHLKDVIVAMRTAFPDLHFAITQIIGEGEWVALHSVMTGTNTGPLRRPLLPAEGPPELPATGRRIEVPHMHMIRSANGQGGELLHLMDTFTMLKQLGLIPTGPPRAAQEPAAIAS